MSAEWLLGGLFLICTGLLVFAGTVSYREHQRQKARH